MNIRSKIAVRLIAVFMIGGIVGGAAYRVVLQRHIRSLFAQRSRGFMNPFRDEILRRTAPESRPAVEALLATHSQRLTEIDGRFRSEIQASFKALLKDLSAYLTSDKIKEVEAFLEGPPPLRDGPPGPGRFDNMPPPRGPGGDPRQPGPGGPGGPGGPPDRSNPAKRADPPPIRL
ncbi:MAG: hypothetical protein PHI34_02910 [Acidobacteriota bacterium]|nr:hypothetical protein [Acidobacteriota bacterium]